jgi:transposase-like protein
MNAYMYNMLLQAREAHWKEFQGEKPNCPFCKADTKQTAENMITSGESKKRHPICMNCPLISLFSLDNIGVLMEDCEDMGRHALQVYEEMGE